MIRFGFVLALALALLAHPGAPVAHAQPETPEPAGKRPLPLAECVRAALQSNRGLRAAAEGPAVAEARYLQSRAVILPQIAGSGQNFRSEQDAGTQVTQGIAGPSPANSDRRFTYGINGEQSIINVMQWKTVSAAAASRDAAESSYRDSQEAMVLEVQRAYYNYLKTTHLLEVAEENGKVGKEQLKLAEKRKEVGTGVEADVLKARAQVAADQLGVITARKNLEIARATLCSVIGFPLDAPLAVEDIDPDAELLRDPAVDIEKSLETRPDILSQRSELLGAERTVAAAKLDRLPTLGFQANYERLHSGSHTETLRDSERTTDFSAFGSWFAGVRLDLPIFRGGAIRGRIREASANERAAAENLAETERRARLEIQTATLNLEAAAEATEVSREGALAAEEDFRVSQGFYTHGLIPILDLTQSQAALVKAKNDAVSARYDYWIAQAELDRALGQGVGKFAP